MIEEKAVDSQLINSAVGFVPNSDGSSMVGDLFDIHMRVVKDIAPWWSKTRDAQLRSFWKDGELTSIVMGVAQNKLASIPMRIVPRDLSINAHVRQAELAQYRLINNSELGLGLHHTMLKTSEDYLGQDNGAFVEILGEGDPSGPIVGMPLGLKHLDAAFCMRTGDPMYPIIYTGEDGIRYKLHNARVIFISQMPSSKRSMYNVGFCSISRSLRIAQNAHNYMNYQDEKMGARAASQILVGTGISGKEIIKSIAAAGHMMDNLGLENLAHTIAFGSTTGELDIKRIELNNLETFDEETSKSFAAYAMAAAWGLEFQELMPITGTKSSEIVSLQRARVRLQQTFIRTFTEQANAKLLPPYLKLEMDYVDDQADQQHAVIQDIISRNFERQMAAGVTTPEVVQQSLFELGYITRAQLRSMQLSRGKLENGTPVQSLFFNKNYDDILLIPRDLLLVMENEADVALSAINENKVYIYSVIGASGSGVIHHKSEEALAALEWLEDQYMQDVISVAEEVEEEEDPDRAYDDGRQTNQERGEVGKATDFFLSNKETISKENLTPWSRFSEAISRVVQRVRTQKRES